MGTFGIPEDQPIENRMITKQLEAAQTRIEGFHFDARKQILAYDDVLNKQRQVVYARRQKLLIGSSEEVVEVISELGEAFPDLKETLNSKEKEFGKDKWQEMMRRLILQVTDILWVEHLEVMSYTRSSVNLRAYGQRDPLIEYRKEGLRLFREMQADALSRIAQILPNIKPEAIEKEEAELQKAQAKAQESGGSTTNGAGKPLRRVSGNIIGRNEIVRITNGTEIKEIKYKKAERLINEEGWRIV
jgi:preprotein translocase subunit SecA